MKRALPEDPLIREAFGISFYFLRLFLFDAFKGLSFFVSTVPLLLLT
jgi:hypothetical protein